MDKDIYSLNGNETIFFSIKQDISSGDEININGISRIIDSVFWNKDKKRLEVSLVGLF